MPSALPMMDVKITGRCWFLNCSAPISRVSTTTVGTSATPVTPLSMTLRPADVLEAQALGQVRRERRAARARVDDETERALAVHHDLRPSRGRCGRGAWARQTKVRDRRVRRRGLRGAREARADVRFGEHGAGAKAAARASNACSANRRLVGVSLMPNNATPESVRRKLRCAKTCAPHGAMSQLRPVGASGLRNRQVRQGVERIT